MTQFFITVAGVFTGLLIFFVFIPFLLIGAIAGSIEGAAEKTMAGGAVLELDLREGLRDQDSVSPFGSFGGPSLSVMRVRKNSSSRMPEIFSTMQPNISVL